MGSKVALPFLGLRLIAGLSVTLASRAPRIVKSGISIRRMARLSVKEFGSMEVQLGEKRHHSAKTFVD